MQDELHLDGLRSGEKSKFKLGLDNATRFFGARASELVRRSEECLRSCR